MNKASVRRTTSLGDDDTSKPNYCLYKVTPMRATHSVLIGVSPLDRGLPTIFYLISNWMFCPEKCQINKSESSHAQVAWSGIF